MTAAPSWAYRSPYTHRLSSALMTDTHPTHMHSCLHRYSRALQIWTHTHALLPPHPPPGLIHLLHLRMLPPWCHPQSHHFKGTKALHVHQQRAQTHPLTFPFVPLSHNGNSPAESPSTERGELHCVLHNQVILWFLPSGAHCTHHSKNDKLSYSSLILLTWKKVPSCLNLSALKNVLDVCLSESICVLSIEWKVAVSTEEPMITAACTAKAPAGNTYRLGMMWKDKAIIPPPH